MSPSWQSDITLLKCTADYPASISDANLKTIPEMRKRFNVKVGYQIIRWKILFLLLQLRGATVMKNILF